MRLSQFSLRVEEFLKFVVEDEHQRTADTSPEVTQITLEKSCEALSLQDLCSAIHCASILSLIFCLSAFHHQSPSNGVQRVCKSLGARSHDLSEKETGKEGSFLLSLSITPDETFSSIIASKIKLKNTRNRKHGK